MDIRRKLNYWKEKWYWVAGANKNYANTFIAFCVVTLIISIFYSILLNSIPKELSSVLLHIVCFLSYILVLSGLMYCLGDRNLVVLMLKLPISIIQIILPEIITIVSAIFYLLILLIMILVFFVIFGMEYKNVYINLIIVFAFGRLYGGFLMRFLVIHVFGLNEKQETPKKEFSAIANAAFYSVCVILMLLSDLNLPIESPADYDLKNTFIKAMLTFLMIDSAYPIISKGVQNIGGCSGIKERGRKFINEDYKGISNGFKRLFIFFLNQK